MGCVAPRSSDAAMANAAGDSSGEDGKLKFDADAGSESASEFLSAIATPVPVSGSSVTPRDVSSAFIAPTYAGTRPPTPPPFESPFDPPFVPPFRTSPFKPGFDPATSKSSKTRFMDTHFILPLVMVPVLSNATVPHSARASKVTPPRTRTPRRAHAPMAATYTSGAMRSAQGAAADKKANARYAAPPRPKNGQPKTSGPHTIVSAVTARIALE